MSYRKKLSKGANKRKARKYSATKKVNTQINKFGHRGGIRF